MTKYELISSMDSQLRAYPQRFAGSSYMFSETIRSHQLAISRLEGENNIAAHFFHIERPSLVEALNDDRKVYEMLGFYENIILGNHTKELVEAGLLNFDEQTLKETYQQLRRRLAGTIDEQEDFLEKYQETDLRNLEMEDLEEAIEDLKFLRAEKEMNQIDLAFLVQQSQLQMQALEAYINSTRQ